MSMNKQAFEQWLDGKAIDSQTQQNWHDDPQLKADYEASLWLKQQSECYDEQEVPKWNRASTFAFEKDKKDWFGWLNVSPGLSMAMSVAAILMVLFRVELQIGDNGVLLTFAGDSNQQMNALVDEKIKQFGRDQQIVLASYVDDIQAQQQQDVTQLASYLINANRTERKEEMGALVSYLKDQRDEDMSLNRQKLNNIIYNFSEQTNKGTVQRVSFNPASTQYSTEPFSEQIQKSNLSNKEEK